jgi:23S rRNA G2069 N7-methylase RlmK/C1962 C5-methylase RlmI
MGQGGMTAGLATKIEVVRTQLCALEKTVIEGREETRRWREEIKADSGAWRGELVGRLDKHELVDDRYHAELRNRVERIESQALEAGQAWLKRLEDLEKTGAAQLAVDTYKKWLVGTVVLAGLSLVFNAINMMRAIGGALVAR